MCGGPGVTNGCIRIKEKKRGEGGGGGPNQTRREKKGGEQEERKNTTLRVANVAKQTVRLLEKPREADVEGEDRKKEKRVEMPFRRTKLHRMR